MKSPPNFQQLFERGNGIVSVKTLLENDVTYHEIKGLLADAVIVRLKRGVYKWAAKERRGGGGGRGGVFVCRSLLGLTPTVPRCRA